MRFHTVARDPPPARRAVTPQRHTIPADRGETIQLLRLAATVLKKSPEDLSALAETNPELMWEWISEFARQKAKGGKRCPAMGGGDGIACDIERWGATIGGRVATSVAHPSSFA